MITQQVYRGYRSTDHSQLIDTQVSPGLRFSGGYVEQPLESNHRCDIENSAILDCYGCKNINIGLQADFDGDDLPNLDDEKKTKLDQEAKLVQLKEQYKNGSITKEEYLQRVLEI